MEYNFTYMLTARPAHNTLRQTVSGSHDLTGPDAGRPEWSRQNLSTRHREKAARNRYDP